MPAMRAERFLDAFEATDRRIELLAHRRIGTADARGHLRRTDAQRRQRNRAAGGQRFHQHAPTVANALQLANDRVERNPDITTDGRTVVERHAHRIMAHADLDARGITRNQRAGDAAIDFDIAEQVIGILETEGKTDQGRHRRQRDVALHPVQRRPSTSLPSIMRFSTMPSDCVAAASDPASGPVRAKHGISSPSASASSDSDPSVPGCRSASSSSPGPSEFGTITVTAAVTERLEMRVTMRDWASAEKPWPPYSFGMIRPNRPILPDQLPRPRATDRGRW